MPMQPIRYADFRVCVHCRTVNHVSTQNCRRCGSPEMVKLAKAAGGKWYLYLAIVLVFVTMLPTGVGELAVIPVAILLCFMIRYHYRLGSLENQAWKLYYMGANENDTYLVNAHESGIVQWRMGLNEAATHYFSEAMRGGMTPIPTRFAMAVCLYNLGNYAAALPMLEAIQFASGMPPVPTAELLVRTYLEVGALHPYQLNFLHEYRLRAEPRLRARIDKLLGIQPDPAAFIPAEVSASAQQPVPVVAEPPQPAVSSPVAAARTLLEEGNAPAAVALCEQAGGSEMAEDVLEVYTHALDALRRVDDAALVAYRRQLVSNPADLAVRLRFCQGLVTRKRYREALGACKMGLEIEPDIRLRYQSALIFLLIEDYQSALAELQTLERTDGYETFIPKGTVHRLIGRCLTGQGLLTAALRQLQQADRSPETLDVLYELGRLLEEKGDMENARTCWEEIYVADVTYRDVALKLK